MGPWAQSQLNSALLPVWVRDRSWGSEWTMVVSVWEHPVTLLMPCLGTHLARAQLPVDGTRTVATLLPKDKGVNFSPKDAQETYVPGSWVPRLAAE